MKSYLKKISLIFIALTAAYYLFFLKPQLILPQSLFKAKKSFTLHRTNLLQNRLALTEMTRLNSSSSNRDQERTQLITQLQTTNQQGLKNITSQSTIKNLPKLFQTLPQLLDQHQTLLQNQQTLINQLTQLNSFSAQLKLIKSPSTITLLTQQTNLILQYNQQIKKIDQQLEKLSL